MPIVPHHKNWLDIDVSPMVPDEFAQFRPVVADAVVFFLEHLPVPRLTELAARQCDLSADASAEERLANLISQCPTLHKLGQVVARDRRLSSELRRRLQTLETMEPTTPVATVTQTIEREIGKDCACALSIDSRALAEASVAVVIPFSFRYVTGYPACQRGAQGTQAAYRRAVGGRAGDLVRPGSVRGRAL